MLYQNRYDSYVGLAAKLQGNHKKLSTQEFKEFEVINYLGCTYYGNGSVFAKCDFDDGVSVLHPVSIGLDNESNVFTGDMTKYTEVFSHRKIVSIKLKAGELRFALTAAYGSPAKQFKIYACCVLHDDRSKVNIKMMPIKKSTSVSPSEADVKVYDINIQSNPENLGGKAGDIFFRFNVAMMVDVLKFYSDDEYIIIKCIDKPIVTNKDEVDATKFFLDSYNEIMNGIQSIEMIESYKKQTFTLQSFDAVNSNLIWSFLDMPIHHMETHLRKIKT